MTCPIRIENKSRIGAWRCGGNLDMQGTGPDERIMCLKCGATWSDGKVPEES